jgi:hypothetical protein
LFAEVHSEKIYVSIEEELKGWNGCSLAQIFALATISLESLKRITQEWGRERERESSFLSVVAVEFEMGQRVG